MTHYSDAVAALEGAIREARSPLPIRSTESRSLTVDQQLKIAEVTALLSISQELSGIRHGQ